jgi:hypothetical protein
MALAGPWWYINEISVILLQARVHAHKEVVLIVSRLKRV